MQRKFHNVPYVLTQKFKSQVTNDCYNRCKAYLMLSRYWLNLGFVHIIYNVYIWYYFSQSRELHDMLSRTDSNVLENWNRDFRFTGRNCNSALIVPSNSTNIIILLPLCRGLLKQKWLNLESIIGNLLKLDKATARKLNYCQLYVNVSIWSSCYLFHVTVFVAYKKVKSFGWNWKQK